MYCANCGKRNSADQTYCEECGTVLSIACSEPPEGVTRLQTVAPAPAPAREPVSVAAAVTRPVPDEKPWRRAPAEEMRKRFQPKRRSNLLAYIVMSVILLTGVAAIWRMQQLSVQAQTQTPAALPSGMEHAAEVLKKNARPRSNNYISRRQEAINLAVRERWQEAIPKLLASWNEKRDYQVALYLFTAYTQTEDGPHRGSNAYAWARRVIAMEPTAITSQGAHQYLADADHPQSAATPVEVVNPGNGDQYVPTVRSGAAPIAHNPQPQRPQSQPPQPQQPQIHEAPYVPQPPPPPWQPPQDKSTFSRYYNTDQKPPAVPYYGNNGQ